MARVLLIGGGLGAATVVAGMVSEREERLAAVTGVPLESIRNANPDDLVQWMRSEDVLPLIRQNDPSLLEPMEIVIVEKRPENLYKGTAWGAGGWHMDGRANAEAGWMWLFEENDHPAWLNYKFGDNGELPDSYYALPAGVKLPERVTLQPPQKINYLDEALDYSGQRDWSRTFMPRGVTGEFMHDMVQQVYKPRGEALGISVDDTTYMGCEATDFHLVARPHFPRNFKQEQEQERYPQTVRVEVSSPKRKQGRRPSQNIDADYMIVATGVKGGQDLPRGMEELEGVDARDRSALFLADPWSSKAPQWLVDKLAAGVLEDRPVRLCILGSGQTAHDQVKIAADLAERMGAKLDILMYSPSGLGKQRRYDKAQETEGQLEFDTHQLLEYRDRPRNNREYEMLLRAKKVLSPNLDLSLTSPDKEHKIPFNLAVKAANIDTSIDPYAISHPPRPVEFIAIRDDAGRNQAWLLALKNWTARAVQTFMAEAPYTQYSMQYAFANLMGSIRDDLSPKAHHERDPDRKTETDALRALNHSAHKALAGEVDHILNYAIQRVVNQTWERMNQLQEQCNVDSSLVKLHSLHGALPKGADGERRTIRLDREGRMRMVLPADYVHAASLMQDGEYPVVDGVINCTGVSRSITQEKEGFFGALNRYAVPDHLTERGYLVNPQTMRMHFHNAGEHYAVLGIGSPVAGTMQRGLHYDGHMHGGFDSWGHTADAVKLESRVAVHSIMEHVRERSLTHSRTSEMLHPDEVVPGSPRGWRYRAVPRSSSDERPLP